MATITINGNSISGRNISINNGKITIDGENITIEDEKTINISVQGDIDKLKVDRCNICEVTGNVGSVKTVSGDVSITGDVSGGDVTSVSGDVKCGHVAGKVSTVSGNIKHRKG